MALYNVFQSMDVTDRVDQKYTVGLITNCLYPQWHCTAHRRARFKSGFVKFAGNLNNGCPTCSLTEGTGCQNLQQGCPTDIQTPLWLNTKGESNHDANTITMSTTLKCVDLSVVNYLNIICTLET